MTAEEAGALLTPAQKAEMDEFVKSAPPLSDAQRTVLTALFAVPTVTASDAA